MKCSVKFGIIAAGICLATLSGMVYADDTAVNFELPTDASLYTRNLLSPELRLLEPRSFDARSFNSPSYNSTSYSSPGFVLAANETGLVQGQAGATSSMAEAATPAAGFKPSLMSGRKAHQYLGLGTVMLAGLTMMAAPDQGSDSASPQPRQTSGTMHTRLARTTAVMAAATVMTGLVFHWDDIHWEDPFTDPDKMHARLGAAGALMMIYAVNKSAHSSVPTSHAGIAEAGALAMVIAIKLTW
jgi:hypothetical protein